MAKRFEDQGCMNGWLVMPFGLTNAPGTLMRLMKQRAFLGKFLFVYLMTYWYTAGLSMIILSMIVMY
jgi:hypothetical protein